MNLTRTPLSSSCQLGQCHSLAKWLSYYLFLPLFLFFSYLDLLHKEGVWESITCQVMSHEWCHMKIESHDEYGKIVHRLYSSCISSIQ